MLRVISIDEVEPGIRERAFGDGLTAEERFQSDLGQYVSPEDLVRLTLQMRDLMHAEVEAGRMLPVVSARGVVGWETPEQVARRDAERRGDRP